MLTFLPVILVLNHPFLFPTQHMNSPADIFAKAVTFCPSSSLLCK